MNNGHRWTSDEKYDAYHMTPDQFIAKHPHINRDALRLKLQRDDKENDLIQLNWCIGYWDLETSGLNARNNTVMVASVADNHGVRTFDRRRFDDERNYLMSIRDALESYDILVGWNSKGFDLDFLSTRLQLNRQRLPRLNRHVDAMVVARNSGQFTKHSLDDVGKALGVEVSKSAFDKDIWANALAGDDEAWSYIAEHCEKDVMVLKLVFEILRPQVRNAH